MSPLQYNSLDALYVQTLYMRSLFHNNKSNYLKKGGGEVRYIMSTEVVIVCNDLGVISLIDEWKKGLYNLYPRLV